MHFAITCLQFLSSSCSQRWRLLGSVSESSFPFCGLLTRLWFYHQEKRMLDQVGLWSDPAGLFLCSCVCLGSTTRQLYWASPSTRISVILSAFPTLFMIFSGRLILRIWHHVAESLEQKQCAFWVLTQNITTLWPCQLGLIVSFGGRWKHITKGTMWIKCIWV